MTQVEKRKPGRPPLNKQKVVPAANSVQPAVRQTGLIPITEEEYNRLNGITPETPVVPAANYVQTLGVITPAVKEVSLQEDMQAMNTPNKVGHFVVINTPHIKGLRINLDKMYSYCKTGGNNSTVQMATENGISSKLDFGTEEAAQAFLAVLDRHCL